MKNPTFFALSALAVSVSAHAGQGDVLVSCDQVPFSDIKRIEIQETDLTGQFVILETKSNGDVVYSPAFGWNEIQKNAYPQLTGWNGYTRTLERTAPGSWSITTRDECGGGIAFFSCADKL